jgi:hypothetical protein
MLKNTFQIAASSIFITIPALAQGIAGLGGPAILSRSGMGPHTANARYTQIRPFVGVNAFYQGGLTPLQLTPSGEIVNRDTFGGMVNWGAYGYQNWRKSALGLGYYGNYRYYNRAESLDGINQRLALQYTREINPRVSLDLVQVGGTYNRGFSLPGLSQFGMPRNAFAATTGIHDPTNELFDNRTYFSSSGAQVTYRKSTRLSFMGGMTGMMVFRTAPGLADMRGYSAVGDMAYRLSRQSTIGLDYAFLKFDFGNQFGSSAAHMMAANYSTRLGRYWSFAARAGVYRAENEFLRRVSIRPEIAAILGQTSAIEAFHGVNYGSVLGAVLSRPIGRDSSVNFNYTRTIVPGNGIYLTSQSDNVGLGYAYAGIRGWGLGASAVYSKYSGFGGSFSRSFESYSASANVGRRLFSSVNFSFAAGIRRAVAGATYRRDTYFISTGFTFSPGEFPVSFW